MSEFAICGAGLSGLATAYHLMRLGCQKLTVFDPEGIGGGASGIAPGLLHKYCGSHARTPWMAEQAFQASSRLLRTAQTVSKEVIFHESGMYRPALNDAQENDFKTCSIQHNDVQWLSSEKFKESFPYANSHPSMYIESALTVRCMQYLQALWKILESQGARFEKRAIESADDFPKYVTVIFAAGEKTHTLCPHPNFTLEAVKGQILEYEWPENLPPLQHALNAKAYIVMRENQKSFLLGSTFERAVWDRTPEKNKALLDLIEKGSEILPFIKDRDPIGHYSAIRASSSHNGHVPFVGKVGSRSYVIAGMGSKGLLYHALLGQRLALAIQNNDIESIPFECKRRLV